MKPLFMKSFLKLVMISTTDVMVSFGLITFLYSSFVSQLYKTLQTVHHGTINSFIFRKSKN